MGTSSEDRQPDDRLKKRDGLLAAKFYVSRTPINRNRARAASFPKYFSHECGVTRASEPSPTARPYDVAVGAPSESLIPLSPGTGKGRFVET